MYACKCYGLVNVTGINFEQNESELTVYPSKSCRLGCSFTLIQQKRAVKTATFESSSKSVYFENGTTLHLSFSSCIRQKRFETNEICIWHVILLHYALNHALKSRDYRCFRIHFHPFLAYETNQCKHCNTMNTVSNVFAKVFLKSFSQNCPSVNAVLQVHNTEEPITLTKL